MMTFGQDRLPEKERWCKAWPENPDAPRKAAYTRWIKGAMDEIAWPSCAECGGPVTAATGGRSGYDGTVTHEPGRYVKGVFKSACLEYMTANPVGPMYGPTVADLVEDGPEVVYVEHGEVVATAPVMSPAIVAEDGGRVAPCARCGRSDFRTPKGRDWHLANNPDCAKYRKPDRHAYATL